MSLLSTHHESGGRQEALSARTPQAARQQQYLDLGSRPLLDVLNAEQVYRARFAATDPWPAASAAAQLPLQHRAAAQMRSILITAPSRP